jgi:hypothetical protein
MTPDMSVSLADAAADDAPEVAVVAAGAVVADAADVPEAEDDVIRTVRE